ncbi:MAG: diaminopimelate epimerase [Polyangiaceae bacterium]|nr:diaminopimelate epimerase [Polyangiaceae bacterium]
MLSFEKYQALGNHFLVIATADPDSFPIKRAIDLCDQNFGVGGDGVLLVAPPTPQAKECLARMVVINSDGSRPEMCGNGLRCVALYLAKQKDLTDQQGSAPTKFVVETDAGPRACSLASENNLNSAQVKTAMGKGRELGTIEHQLQGEMQEFTRISMGNPHAILFAPPISAEELDELGPALSSQIPEGSNIEIASVIDPQRIKVDVWERGVGRTLACGTGAAATAFAATRLGHTQTDTPLIIELPGGELTLHVAKDDAVELTGPAQFVFEGQTLL